MRVQGKRYHVVFQTPGVHYKPREFVGTYLGKNDVLGTDTFSMRPVAGTAELDPATIITCVETQAPCQSPAIFQGG